MKLPIILFFVVVVVVVGVVFCCRTSRSEAFNDSLVGQAYDKGIASHGDASRVHAQEAAEQRQLVEIAEENGEAGVDAEDLHAAEAGREADHEGDKVGERRDGDAHARVSHGVGNEVLVRLPLGLVGAHERGVHDEHVVDADADDEKGHHADQIARVVAAPREQPESARHAERGGRYARHRQRDARRRDAVGAERHEHAREDHDEHEGARDEHRVHVHVRLHLELERLRHRVAQRRQLDKRR